MTATTENLIQTEMSLGAHNYKPIDVMLTRGEGVWLWDTDGNRYLDCLSAYSAVNQGHCHPRIMAAMVEQAGKLTLTSRAFRNDQLALFYEEIAKLTGSHKILPMNSGAEAVESAVKAVRKWGYEVKGVPDGEAEIIVAANNFHGRTLGIVGFSTDPVARRGFGPFAPGFKVVKFGDIAEFEAALGPNTVGFLIEPIQGEADVTLVGKALSGGFYPVSAVLSNTEVLGVLRPGEHGSTFGGNPLACAVARMALRVLVDEGMVENAAEQGAYFMDGLEQIRSNSVKEVRGRGLMLAVELHADAGGARRYCDALKAQGILCKDTHEHSIRIAPPLVITRGEVDWTLERFAKVLTEMG